MRLPLVRFISNHSKEGMFGVRKGLVSLSILCVSVIILLASVALASHFKRDREVNDDEDRYLKIYSSDDERNKHLHIFTEYIPRRERYRYQSRNYRAMMSRGQHKHSKHRLETVKGDDSYERRLHADNADEDNGIAERMMYFGGEKTSLPTRIKANDLILKTCDGTDNDPIKVRDFQIIGPPVFPGDIKIGFDVESLVNIGSPVEGEFEVYKRVLGAYIKLPCINDIGSCTYEDVCKISQYKKPCPAIFQKNNLPCTCPISKGRYKSDYLELYLGMTDSSNVPNWLTDGEYMVKLTLRSGSRRLMCMQANVSAEKLTN